MMAIGSGWVGSSGVSTTGQRWMSAAGSKVKVNTPFWMSGLVGKAVQDFTMVVGNSTYDIMMQATNTQWVTGTMYYGGYSNNSTTTGAALAISGTNARIPSINATGSVSGTLLGCAITHISQGKDTVYIYIGLTNGPNQSFTLSLGGTNFSFAAYSFANNTQHYRASASSNWLYNKKGQTLEGIKV